MAARETGSLFLADGDIQRAWPYFRAIGDRETIAAAIDAADPGDQVEAVIDIALGERVHPRKGLELVIAQHGICRAITLFEQIPDLENREACLILLVRTLHADLVSNLKRAIERQEGGAPASNNIRDLIAERDWLFGEFSAYVDTSHVINVLQFALDLEDRDTIRLALELCEYGAHLSPQFKMRGEAPFDDIYRDQRQAYLRVTWLGEKLLGRCNSALPIENHWPEDRWRPSNPRRCWWDCWCITNAIGKQCKYRLNILLASRQASSRAPRSFSFANSQGTQTG